VDRQAPISYEDVSRAATRLIGRGAKVTIDALYEQLGRRGSRTTIHKHHKTFLKTFSEQGMTMLPSALPEALVPLVEDFWNQAVLAAGVGFDNERADYDHRIAELGGAINQRAERIQQLETLLDERETLLTQKSQQLDQRDRTIGDLERWVEGKEAEVGELKHDKQALETRLAEERVHWSERYDAAKSDWDRQRGQLEHDIAKTREQMGADQIKHERLVDHWMLQLDDARQHISDLKLRHHEDRERLQGEVRLEKARADRFATDQAKLEKRIDALVSDCEQLEHGRKALQEKLVASDEAREQLAENNRVLARDSESLETEMDALSQTNDKLGRDIERLRSGADR